MVPYHVGDALDHGVQELLASEEWELQDGELLDFFFKNHKEFRPHFGG